MVALVRVDIKRLKIKKKKRKRKLGSVFSVPRNHGIVGHAQIILDLMNISVANSTAVYFNVNIFWACVSAKKV